jgi:hypothetical protein
MTNRLKVNPDPNDMLLHSSKRPYQQPHLNRYGSVSALTQAGGATMSEQAAGASTLPYMAASDRSIKAAIARIGDHPLGIGIYLFDYKPEYRDTWGHGRQFGVMADEVEQVMPEAVSLHPQGYKMVNYAMLGISRPLH